MAMVKLSDLKPGMSLAEDIHNFQGLLLVKKNTTLSKKNIRMLKSWGISRAEIDNDAGQKMQKKTESRNELKKSIEKEMTEKFSGLLDDPIMLEIMTVATALMVKRRTENED